MYKKEIPLLIVRTDPADLIKPYFLNWMHKVPEFAKDHNYRYLNYDRENGNLSWVGFSDTLYENLDGFFLIKIHDEGYWSLKFLFVNPEKRGMGYGKQLLEFAIERASLSRQSLVLRVWEDNKPALNLYKAHGFREYDSSLIRGRKSLLMKN